MDWEDVSYVISSTQRSKLFQLLETPRTPSQLAKLSNISLSNIWIKLKGLEEKKLIKCFTPKVRKGKIYGLTEKGKKAILKITQMNGCQGD